PWGARRPRLTCARAIITNGRPKLRLPGKKGGIRDRPAARLEGVFPSAYGARLLRSRRVGRSRDSSAITRREARTAWWYGRAALPRHGAGPRDAAVFGRARTCSGERGLACRPGDGFERRGFRAHLRIARCLSGSAPRAYALGRRFPRQLGPCEPDAP